MYMQKFPNILFFTNSWSCDCGIPWAKRGAGVSGVSELKKDNNLNFEKPYLFLHIYFPCTNNDTDACRQTEKK